MPTEHGGLSGLARNVRWTYVGVLVQLAVNLFLVGYAVRVLGPADYGLFALFQGIASLLYVVDFGLGMGVVTASARSFTTEDPMARAEALAEIAAAHQVYLRVGIGVGALALLSLAPVWLTVGAGAAAALTLVLLAAGLNLGMASPTGVATGNRRFDLLAKSMLAGSLLSLLTVVGLLHAVGLAALGLGQLAGAAASRLVLIAGLRPTAAALGLRLRPVNRSGTRRVLSRATPLVVTNAGNQAINAANLAVIAAVASTAAVGVFRAAAAIPTQAVGLLFRGFDVAFPNIVSAEEGLAQERLAGDVTRVASYVGGVGLGWLIADREPIAHLLFGRPSHSGAEVLALFAVVWLVNIPAHGLSLVVVARDCQRVFVGLTIFEAIVDISLTIILAMRFGAPGAAWASVISIGGSNVIILPILARRCAPWTVKRGLWADGYLPLVGGVLLALGIALVVPQAAGPFGDGAVVLLAGLLAGVVVVGRRGRALLRESLKGT